MLNNIGQWLARKLAEPRHDMDSHSGLEVLENTLQPGDVLLVEGSSRFSSAIKYLTQSTWSHASLYVGTVDGEPHQLIEADVNEGVRLLPLSHYRSYPARICRPVGLSDTDIAQVTGYALERLGYQYDLKNIVDLMRYLVQSPPVPQRWRRKMLSLGSGDPTRAICSSLIAQSFHSVCYPILPEIEHKEIPAGSHTATPQEIMYIRHHSLFVPRDFDLSPYFDIIKPTLEQGFDHRKIDWGGDEPCRPLRMGPELPVTQ